MNNGVAPRSGGGRIAKLGRGAKAHTQQSMPKWVRLLGVVQSRDGRSFRQTYLSPKRCGQYINPAHPFLSLTLYVATTYGDAACPTRPNSLSHNNLEQLLHSEIFSGEVGLILSIIYSIMGL